MTKHLLLAGEETPRPLRCLETPDPSSFISVSVLETVLTAEERGSHSSGRQSIDARGLLYLLCIEI
jgi:hypothetical protein